MRILLVFLLLVKVAQGQGDSLKIQAGTTALFANKGYQPLWLTANQWGVYSDRKNDVTSFLSLTNSHPIPLHDSTSLKFIYGLGLYNNQHFKSVFLSQAYLKLLSGNWQLGIGRYREVSGSNDLDLSSGSLGVSTNALPLPKISIAVITYSSVPFTKGLFQYKGQFDHGWWGNDRFMKSSFYHHKAGYIRVGKKKLKLYGGAEHFVEWGGHTQKQQTERSWKGFWDVIALQEENDGTVPGGILPNRAGDGRGFLEAGFEWENDKLYIQGFHQVPLEVGGSVDPKNIDGLNGLNLHFKQATTLKKLTLEFIYTRQMADFLAESYSYYNNGAYKTGWEYKNRIIGTPLFINRQRGQYYFKNIQPFNWNVDITPGNQNIIVNRIIGAHIGLLYQITPVISAKTLLTYTYNDLSFVRQPPASQAYLLQEFFVRPLRSKWMVNCAAGLDAGGMSNVFGARIGIQYQVL